ncbi:hypothetical protein FQA39_LY13427 [Lamprigera yunnana]|nr:hypothetical protein FQA39_LY13427 [Lamprigera yunnana]
MIFWVLELCEATIHAVPTLGSSLSGESSDLEVPDSKDNSVQTVNREFPEEGCSEESSEVEYNNITQSSTNDIFVAPSGMHWDTVPPSPSTKVRACNIIRCALCLKTSKIFRTPRGAFQWFVTEAMLQEIVCCTNLEGKRVSLKRKQNWGDVD